MKRIDRLFAVIEPNLRQLDELASISDPRSCYVIAITPRSGSSYLCDVMKELKCFGTPTEALNDKFIPRNMRKVPGRSPDEYLRNYMRSRKTKNGVSGVKASWFQFQNFIKCISEVSYVLGFKYIYLTRSDIIAQSVSLYKAAASQVFHTNKKHSEASLQILESLEYDHEKIEHWYKHLLAQEAGWELFFENHGIVPLRITYEELDNNILATMKRIARHVGVRESKVVPIERVSRFERIRDERNTAWARRFRLECQLPEYGR